MAHGNLDDARLVLGDEMLAAGEPLGELVAVQAALARTPEDDVLLSRERQLWRENEERWFGELAAQMRKDSLVDYGWRLGFLDSLTLRTTNARFYRETTTSSPARFLRRLVVDLRDRRPDEQRTIDGSLSDLVAPRLEEFEYRPNEVTRAPLGAVVERANDWRELTSLTVRLRDDVERLPTVLATYPKLVHLSLRGASNRVWLLLAESPALARLRTLNLSFGSIDAIPGFERFAHLERLSLGDNQIDAGIVEELRQAFGSRVEIGIQHPGSEAESRRARYQGALQRVMAEQAADEDWDSDFNPSPHNPYSICKNELAVPEAVPFLIEALELNNASRRWVLEALKDLGPAAVAASDALFRLNQFAWIVEVDQERGRGLRIDRVRPTRSDLCRRLENDPAALARHLRDLLDDDDPDVVVFALDALGTDRSFLSDLMREHPDPVPVGHIRMLLGHENPMIHASAAARLVDMHLPEDADRVIAHLARGRKVQPAFMSWLGSHPESDKALASDLELHQIFHLVRRRRCAGLTTDVRRFHQRLIDAFSSSSATEGGHTRDREWALEYASRIVHELRLVELARLIAFSLDQPTFEPMVEALRAAGDAGRKAVEEAAVKATGHQAEVLSWAKTALARAPYVQTLDNADRLFIEGKLDDPTLFDSAAYGYYANILWHDPRCARAGFQMAWIERGYGSKISPARIAWLRALGVAEDLLDDLARRPKRIMPGYGSGFDRPRRETNLRRAAWALDAELWSVAANYFPEGSEESKSARQTAEAHVRRLRG